MIACAVLVAAAVYAKPVLFFAQYHSSPPRPAHRHRQPALALFVNGLRSKRGKMELVSRIIVTSAFALGGLGGFTLATVSAYYFFAGNGRDAAHPAVADFFFWQVFPVMSTAFTNNPDSSDLLRFPLTYRSYFLIRLAYGFCDPASALGTRGFSGFFWASASHAQCCSPGRCLCCNLRALQSGPAANCLRWLERWLAQRRTREILGVSSSWSC